MLWAVLACSAALRRTSCSESPLISSLHPGTTSPHFRTFAIVASFKKSGRAESELPRLNATLLRTPFTDHLYSGDGHMAMFGSIADAVFSSLFFRVFLCSVCGG